MGIFRVKENLLDRNGQPATDTVLSTKKWGYLSLSGKEAKFTGNDPNKGKVERVAPAITEAQIKELYDSDSSFSKWFENTDPDYRAPWDNTPTKAKKAKTEGKTE